MTFEVSTRLHVPQMRPHHRLRLDSCSMDRLARLGPIHIENYVNGIELVGTSPINTNEPGEGLGQAFDLYGVTGFSNVTSLITIPTGSSGVHAFQLHLAGHPA